MSSNLDEDVDFNDEIEEPEIIRDNGSDAGSKSDRSG